jgi:Bacterial PH domain
LKEYDAEPLRGLPEALPTGETILWQGAPRWGALARRAFHVLKVAIYFAVLLGWIVASDQADGTPFQSTLSAALWLALGAGISIGLLTLFAWLIARSTLYTITDRRVVMRFGVAIPLAFNLPFRQIKSADLRRYADGTGDIPLTLMSTERISYVVLWPHARPWYFVPAQPMLRAIPDAAHVAEILAEAFATEAATRLPSKAPSTPETPASPGSAAQSQAASAA